MTKTLQEQVIYSPTERNSRTHARATEERVVAIYIEVARHRNGLRYIRKTLVSGIFRIFQDTELAGKAFHNVPMIVYKRTSQLIPQWKEPGCVGMSAPSCQSWENANVLISRKAVKSKLGITPISNQPTARGRREERDA